jgi:hypothetical protein
MWAHIKNISSFQFIKHHIPVQYKNPSEVNIYGAVLKANRPHLTFNHGAHREATTDSIS